MLALVAPGQGAQTPGFLAPWLEIPAVADRMAWWSTVTGLDLARYGTEADAEEIRDTAVAQPLLVSAALASVLCVFPHPADAFRQVGVAAGHSVGEISALAGTNVVSAESALVLVRERGRAMAEASAVTRDRHDRRARRRPGRGARRDREARPHRRQPQRRRPGRRGRHARAARGVRRRPAGEGTPAAALGRRRVPHRAHAPSRRSGSSRSAARSRCATLVRDLCPTPTAW